MKNRRRPFYSGILNHVYQRTKDGFLLFYTFIDFLVHFTTMCILARRYDITVLSFCQMPDHTHGGYISHEKKELAAFMRDLSMWYAKYGQAPQCRGGEVFSRHYGSAPKNGDKRARTTLVYIGNNPVERHLVKQAEDYRWNFLAYADSDHPFSEPLFKRDASNALKRALTEVDATHAQDLPLSYNLLKRLFSKLDNKETQQLIDYIITVYSVIDYDAAISFFGNYNNMIGAMHYTTGGEYDINETFTGRSDTCYSDIDAWLMKNLHPNDIHDIFLMPGEERTDLLFRIYKATGTDTKMIAKYLRLKLEK